MLLVFIMALFLPLRNAPPTTAAGPLLVPIIWSISNCIPLIVLFAAASDSLTIGKIIIGKYSSWFGVIGNIEVWLISISIVLGLDTAFLNVSCELFIENGVILFIDVKYNASGTVTLSISKSTSFIKFNVLSGLTIPAIDFCEYLLNCSSRSRWPIVLYAWRFISLINGKI